LGVSLGVSLGMLLGVSLGVSLGVVSADMALLSRATAMEDVASEM
jgi:ABC-type nitrate/sulfonate/bicarbonate transport system permease component